MYSIGGVYGKYRGPHIFLILLPNNNHKILSLQLKSIDAPPTFSKIHFEQLFRKTYELFEEFIDFLSKQIMKLQGSEV